MSEVRFVPIALREDEAEHVLGAVAAVLASCREAGRPPTEYAGLAAAQIRLAQAYRKALASTGEDNDGR